VLLHGHLSRAKQGTPVVSGAGAAVIGRASDIALSFLLNKGIRMSSRSRAVGGTFRVSIAAKRGCVLGIVVEM
jgi:hypothetical protein